MLLGMDYTPSGTNPTVENFSADPTTVMEMPALGAKPDEAKEDAPKKEVTDSANAAAEALSRYMHRPANITCGIQSPMAPDHRRPSGVPCS